jgi:hypothetical protein
MGMTFYGGLGLSRRTALRCSLDLLCSHVIW